MKARCLVHTPADRVELREVAIREPQAGEVLVEAAYTCISPGTELRCLRTMKAGEPYVPGYALAGRVLRCGPGVKAAEGAAVLVPGTRDAGSLQTCWGGHISHAIVHPADLCPIPAGVDLLDASAARMASISYHGLRLSRPLASEQVAVIGLGLIGQFAARLHQLSGARVVAADRSAHRVAVAQAAGIEAVVVAGTLKDTFGSVMPQGADIIVDATGVPKVLPEAIEVGRDIPWDNTPFTGVRYLVQGSYEDGFTVPYNEAFFKEMSFLLPRSFQMRDALAVLDLVARKRLAVHDLVHVASPEDAPAIYAQLRDPSSPLLTAAFKWQTSACG